MSILYSHWRLLVCSPLNSQSPKEYLVCCGHSYILLTDWMNEWNENKNIITTIVVVVYSRCDCLYQTKRTISEDEDSILPVVHIPYSLPVGSWLFLCAFEILLMFFICISYGGTMRSSPCCHTHGTHTHTLRSWDWDTAEEPVLNLQGASQVLCWRSGTSDKAKPDIPVWRCLWDILPTIFFNQAILLLRNLQWRPSFSRKKKSQILALGVIHKLAPAYHPGPSPTTPLLFLLEGTSFAPDLTGYCLCSITTLWVRTHVFIYCQSLSSHTAPNPAVITLPLFVYQRSSSARALWLPHHLSFGISMVSSFTCNGAQFCASDAPCLRPGAHRKPVLTTESSAPWGQDRWLSTPLPVPRTVVGADWVRWDGARWSCICWVRLISSTENENCCRVYTGLLKLRVQ